MDNKETSRASSPSTISGSNAPLLEDQWDHFEDHDPLNRPIFPRSGSPLSPEEIEKCLARIGGAEKQSLVSSESCSSLNTLESNQSEQQIFEMSIGSNDSTAETPCTNAQESNKDTIDSSILGVKQRAIIFSAVETAPDFNGYTKKITT